MNRISEAGKCIRKIQPCLCCCAMFACNTWARGRVNRSRHWPSNLRKWDVEFLVDGRLGGRNQLLECEERTTPEKKQFGISHNRSSVDSLSCNSSFVIQPNVHAHRFKSVPITTARNFCTGQKKLHGRAF